MGRARKVLAAVAAARSDLLDSTGLALLATAAFTWSVTAGFVAAGVGVLALNWRLNEGRRPVS